MMCLFKTKGMGCRWNFGSERLGKDILFLVDNPAVQGLRHYPSFVRSGDFGPPKAPIEDAARGAQTWLSRRFPA
jgi:hypothetical protein